MKVIDLAIKDLKRSMRSRFLLGMTLLAPLVITGLIFFAFGGVGSEESSNLPEVTIGIVNLDQVSPDSPIAIGEALVAMFTDPSVTSWLAASQFTDETMARAALDRQEIGSAVIVPPGFSNSILSGSPAQPIRIVHDPTLTSSPTIIRSMVTSLLDGFTGGGVAVQVVAQRQAAHGLTLSATGIQELATRYQEWYTAFQRALYHDPAQAALFISAPGSESSAAQLTIRQIMGLVMAGQMIFFSFYTGAYAMMSILTEQEEGTLARLFTTPTNRTIILAGKFLAVLLAVFLQGCVLIIAARLAFQVDWGKPASMLMAILGQVVAATGLGTLLISLVKTSKQAGPILGGGLTMLGMLSVLFTVGVPNMPDFFNKIALFTPQGWVMRDWRLAMTGSPASEMWLPVMVTVGIGLAMFAVGATLFHRRFA